jgi:hypothetical protein
MIMISMMMILHHYQYQIRDTSLIMGSKKKVLFEPFYHMIIHFKIPNKDKIQR